MAITSAFQADDVGSIPITRSRHPVLTAVFLQTLRRERHFSAHIAQSVEHFLGKEEVAGSNPAMSSIFGQ